MKLAIFATLLVSSVLTYDQYNQCDSRWGNDKYGPLSSTSTICQLGGFLSSLAMLLDDCDQDLYGFDVNPGTLNQWLRANNGYSIVGSSVTIYVDATDKLSNGVKYDAFTQNTATMQYYMDKGDAAILCLDAGTRCVLGYGYSGSTFFVADPLSSRNSIRASEVQQAVLYTRPYWCKS